MKQCPRCKKCYPEDHEINDLNSYVEAGFGPMEHREGVCSFCDNFGFPRWGEQKVINRDAEDHAFIDAQLGSVESRWNQGQLIDGDVSWLVTQLKEAREENKRLRAALEEIYAKKNMTLLNDCCVEKTCHELYRHGDLVSACGFQYGVMTGHNAAAELAREALGEK